MQGANSKNGHRDRPKDRRPGVFLEEGRVRRAGFRVRTFGAYWAEPGRTLWTPVLAGIGMQVWELAEHLRPDELRDSYSLLKSPAREDDEPRRVAIVEFARATVTLLRLCWPEHRAIAELGLGATVSHVDRLRVLRGRLAETSLPAPWIAAHLPVLIAPRRGQRDQFLQATGLYRSLGVSFGELALRQGFGSWDSALSASHGFWRSPRATEVLRSIVPPAEERRHRTRSSA
jgi:hypothetical protein